MSVRGFSAGISGVLMAVFLVGGVLFAQTDTGKIEGFVRDKDTGQPLAGAQVAVEGTRLGNITTDDGYYFILNVPAGLHSVKCNFTGYQTVTQTSVRILVGHTATVDFNLSGTVIALEGITVEAEAEPLIVRDNTMTKQRQTAEQIEALPISNLDALINMQAGVQGQRGGRISIRGGRVGEEAVYVDGVLVKNFAQESLMNPVLSNTSLSQLMPQLRGHEPDNSPLDVNLNAVEEITIITGGFQAEYGLAKSGVVNIVTKEGGMEYRGRVRYRTDGVLPRTMDFGFNEIEGSFGGPVPLVPYTFFHGSAQVQGRADWSPTDTREEFGFHTINQTVVDRINAVIGPSHARKASLAEFEQVFDIMGMPNPARREGNIGDYFSIAEKVTSSPIEGLKLIQTFNHDRTQRIDYSWSRSFYWQGNLLDRKRTTNLMAGADWTIQKSGRRSSNLQVRASYMKDKTVVGQPWEHSLLTRSTIGGFGWKDIKTWGEAARFDLYNFLLYDPWYNQVEDWPNRLYTLWNSGWILETLDQNQNGSFDFMEDENLEVVNEISTESMNADFRFLASELGITRWGRDDPETHRGPWGISNSVFRDGGQGGIYFERRAYNPFAQSKDQKYGLKVDFDSQIDRYNRIKLGVDMQYSDNYNYDGGYSYPPATLLDNEPYVLSAYAQNRFDLGDFVLDFGIRVDHMDPKGDEATSLKNYPGEMAKKHTRKITEFAPRVGVAFPVTDRTQVRFSFGHFYQPPSWRMLLRGDRLMQGQAVLDMSRTVSFEAGFTAMLAQDMTIDIVGYHKDVQGDFAYRQYIIPPGDLGTTTVTNMAYANVKGADFDFNVRVGNYFNGRLSYALQFARTTETEPGTKETSLISQKDPITQELQYLPSFEDPLGYDRTHTINAQTYLSLPQDFRQGTWEGKILNNVNMAVIFRLRTGSPFDLRFMGGRTTGGRSILPLTNAARGATSKSFDLRVGKTFSLGQRRKISVFADITNLFYNRGFRSMYYPGVIKTIDEEIVSLEKRRPDPIAAKITWLPILVDPQDEDDYWWMRQHDLDQDGIISGDEWRIMKVLNHVMGYQPNGSARWIRLGVEYSF